MFFVYCKSLHGLKHFHGDHLIIFSWWSPSTHLLLHHLLKLYVCLTWNKLYLVFVLLLDLILLWIFSSNLIPCFCYITLAAMKERYRFFSLTYSPGWYNKWWPGVSEWVSLTPSISYNENETWMRSEWNERDTRSERQLCSDPDACCFSFCLGFLGAAAGVMWVRDWNDRKIVGMKRDVEEEWKRRWEMLKSEWG